MGAVVNDKPAFEIKGASFTLLVLHLHSAELSENLALLDSQMAGTPDFFSHDPVVIDLTTIQDSEQLPDIARIAQALQRYKLVLTGVCNGSPAQMQAAQALGFGLFNSPASALSMKERRPKAEPAASPANDEPAAAPDASAVPARASKIITTPVRTGQQVYAQGGDLIVLAPVSAGAEVLADGNIHVYASLRGRALAGAKGDTSARIFIRSMQAELVSIAGSYRVINEQLLQQTRGKSVQVFLRGEQLVIEVLS